MIKYTMITVVGLGNPGSEYRDTRHNIGWMVLSALIEQHALSACVQSSRYTALVSEGVIDGIPVSVLLPTGYMNNSGVSVARYLKERGDINHFIVVHDDVDILFGDIRISYDRGAGGHNGVQSIINTCATKQFARIRVGVAQKNIFGVVRRPTGENLSSFVLAKFKKDESEALSAVFAKVDVALRLILTKGVEQAMQEVNKGIDKIDK